MNPELEILSLKRNDTAGAVQFACKVIAAKKWSVEIGHTLLMLQDDPESLMNELEQLFKERSSD